MTAMNTLSRNLVAAIAAFALSFGVIAAAGNQAPHSVAAAKEMVA